MRQDYDNQRLYVRQSWLNDIVICPERARFGLTKPEMRSGSDATIMGTAVHAGIEHVLGSGTEMPLTDMVEYTIGFFNGLKETESWKETNINPEKYEIYIESMCTAWYNDIQPHVEFGGRVEDKFRTPLGIMVGGWEVWLEGTMDYVTPSGVVWDWKTASRAYNIKEKQSTSIQASVYTLAVNNSIDGKFPLEFKYGVMVRQEKPKAQIVTVMRDTSHASWLQQIVSSSVTMALAIGEDKHWLLNDTSALCSEKWCSYWSICKGAYLTETDLSPLSINFE
jgi:hypothetical protein